MSSGQLMEPGNPFHALGQSATPQPPALLVLHMHVMVSLSPVHPSEDQPSSSRPATNLTMSPRTPAAR